MKLAFVLFSMVAFASPQGQERGGGKQMELDFVEIARLGFSSITTSLSLGNQEFEGFDANAYLRALSATQVSSVPHLCETKINEAGGAKTTCLDARYFPEQQKIELSEKEWPLKTCLEQMALTVHEYGRASGNENGNYWFSARIAKSMAARDACALWEANGGRACEDDFAILKRNLDRLVAKYRKNKPGDSEPKRERFFTDLANIVKDFNYSRSGACNPPREKNYCLNACNEILDHGCHSACWR